MFTLNYNLKNMCLIFNKLLIIYYIILEIKYMLFNILQDIEHFSGPCHKIIDYPSKGFVFVLKSGDLLSNFVK